MANSSSFDPSHGRARKIVERASKQVRNPFSKSWLFMDEKGTWEKTAREYLEETADKARGLGMSEDEVDHAIADRLSLLALEASLKYAKEHGTKRRRR